MELNKDEWMSRWKNGKWRKLESPVGEADGMEDKWGPRLGAQTAAGNVHACVIG